MTCTLLLPSTDIPSHFSSGMVLRGIGARVEPFQLYGPMARKFMFGFTAPQSDLIVATGHGDPDELKGIWKVGGIDRNQVNDKVIELISCNCGKELGPELVKQGAKAVIGFDDDLNWIVCSDNWSDPWNDKYTREALQPIVDGLNNLLDGRTIYESYLIQKNGLLKNAANSDFELSRSCLEFDAAHIVLLGDGNTTIRARPRVVLPPPPPLIF